MDLYLKEMFGSTERMKQAIEHGIEKKMRLAVLNEMCDPEYRAQWCYQIACDKYEIEEPYMMAIPKPHTYDPETKGPKMRNVVVCSNPARIFLSMANDITFEKCGEKMIHPSCMSYQKGIGCGKVIKRCISQIERMASLNKGHKIGVKLDLSKYFDSVPRWLIHEKLDEIEEITGKSHVLDVIRKFYDDDRIWDKTADPEDADKYVLNTEYYLTHKRQKTDKGLHILKDQSLKQGVAMASFLADACLYDMDAGVCGFDVFYVRYSDDMLIIGPEWRKALKFVEKFLAKLGMKLNPDKVEELDDRKWFKFLGFNIRGSEVTLAANRLDTFKKKVQDATIKRVKKIGQGIPMPKLLGRLYRELYGTQASPYSWAGGVLMVINNKHDIMKMNGYILSCLRAAANGYTRVSGLGCDIQGKDGCLKREQDRWFLINKKAVGESINGYNTIENMLELMKQDGAAFRMELRDMYRELKNGLTPAFPKGRGL